MLKPYANIYLIAKRTAFYPAGVYLKEVAID